MNTELWIAPLSGKASDLPVEGFIMLEKEIREWAQARRMHLFCSGNMWHVMIGKKFCTPAYPTAEQALEACWESGEYDDVDECLAAFSPASGRTIPADAPVATIAAPRAELNRQDAPVIERGFTHSPEKRRV